MIFTFGTTNFITLDKLNPQNCTLDLARCAVDNFFDGVDVNHEDVRAREERTAIDFPHQTATATTSRAHHDARAGRSVVRCKSISGGWMFWGAQVGW